MKTFQFRPLTNNRYEKEVFSTKCVKRNTAVIRFLKSGKRDPKKNYRMVQLTTHGERDVSTISKNFPATPKS